MVLNNYELQKKATFNLLKEINNYNELIDLSFYGKHFKIIISEEYNEYGNLEKFLNFISFIIPKTDKIIKPESLNKLWSKRICYENG